MHRSIISVAVTVLSAGWLIAQPAVAQTNPGAPNAPSTAAPKAPGTAAPNATVSDQKLDQAAAAIQQVTTIRKDYAGKLAGASPDEQDKLAQEAHTAMQKAVTDQGLSIDEYNSIVQTAQNNPSVRDQIMKRLGGSGNSGNSGK
ncbi:MAG TPA: DUF4168 domain-containing protein [Stellaceae bacterium]